MRTQPLWSLLALLPLVATPAIAQGRRAEAWLDAPPARKKSVGPSPHWNFKQVHPADIARSLTTSKPMAYQTLVVLHRQLALSKIDLDARGKSVRAILTELTKKVGFVWKAEGKLVQIFPSLRDDPLHGQIGLRTVRGKTLRSWRHDLYLKQRSGATAAASALAQADAPGWRVLIQFMLQGTFHGSWGEGAVRTELQRGGAPAATLMLDELLLFGRRGWHTYTIMVVFETNPAASSVYLERLKSAPPALQRDLLQVPIAHRRWIPDGIEPVLAKLVKSSDAIIQRRARRFQEEAREAKARRQVRGSPARQPSKQSPTPKRPPRKGPDQARDALKLLREAEGLIPKLGTPSPSKKTDPKGWAAARAVRKAAAKRLQEIGRVALPPLRQAARNKGNKTLQAWAAYVIKKIERTGQ